MPPALEPLVFKALASGALGKVICHVHAPSIAHSFEMDWVGDSVTVQKFVNQLPTHKNAHGTNFNPNYIYVEGPDTFPGVTLFPSFYPCEHVNGTCIGAGRASEAILEVTSWGDYKGGIDLRECKNLNYVAAPPLEIDIRLIYLPPFMLRCLDGSWERDPYYVEPEMPPSPAYTDPMKPGHPPVHTYTFRDGKLMCCTDAVTHGPVLTIHGNEIVPCEEI